MTQLIENSLERMPSKIKLVFYDHSLGGFDLYDDGEMIEESEMDEYCHAFLEVNRKRNQIYKQRSLGYRGQAMDTLAFYSDLVVVTRSKD